MVRTVARGVADRLFPGRGRRDRRLLWWVSVATARKYEARVSTARPRLIAAWPLTKPGFWRGQELVDRQGKLHVAAACAAVALIAALPAGQPPAARWVAAALSAAVLAAAAISIALPLADRHEISLVHGGRPPSGRADGWCWGVLAAALAALVTTALVSGFTDRQSGCQTGALPGLTGFLAWLGRPGGPAHRAGGHRRGARPAGPPG